MQNKQTEEKVEDTETCPQNNRLSLSNEKLKQLFKKLDLSGIQDWSKLEQQEVKEIIIEDGFLFVLDDLDVEKTSVVKHSIKLTDYTPQREVLLNSSSSI